MAAIIIAFDEKDTQLGGFFSICKKQLDFFMNSVSISYTEINSDRLNDLAVSLLTRDLDHFIFGAYSHGDATSLLKSGKEKYLSIEQNGKNFCNSLIYNFSCDAGSKLGKEVIECGCHCFIGYKKTIYIWTHHMEVFATCANHGLIEFLNGKDSEFVLELMIQKYNEQIDLMYKIDFGVASELRANRDALIMHGKKVSLDQFD